MLYIASLLCGMRTSENTKEGKIEKHTTSNGCISLRCVQSEFKRGIGLELTRCALCIWALVSPYFQVVRSHYKCWLHENTSVTSSKTGK